MSVQNPSLSLDLTRTRYVGPQQISIPETNEIEFPLTLSARTDLNLY